MKVLKNIKLLIFTNVFLLILSSNAFSQSCQGFHHHKNCRIYDSYDFKQYGQTRSALLEINKSFTYQAVFYGQKDYKMNVCTESGYYPVHYRLINAENKEIFFDNSEDDYVESVGFTIDKNITMIIEVTILAEDINPEDPIDIRACAGIMILWRKAPKLGF